MLDQSAFSILDKLCCLTNQITVNLNTFESVFKKYRLSVLDGWSSFLLQAFYCVDVSVAALFIWKYKKFSRWLNGETMPLILHHSWQTTKRYVSSLDGHQTSFLQLLFLSFQGKT